VTAYVVIPMKSFRDAKSRLRDRLSDAERCGLARAMFERVLSAARQCSAEAQTLVLTNGPDVAELAQAGGAEVLWDPELPEIATGARLGALIDAALLRLTARGAARALVLMGDLPFIEAQDVAELLDALERCDLALAPDARGPCTNALAVRLPIAFPTAFGHPHSYAVHSERARERGLRLSELGNRRLAHDVDTAEDLPSGAAWRDAAQCFHG
jgi:2-phospho-L-lactate guanylyltransferase